MLKFRRHLLCYALVTPLSLVSAGCANSASPEPASAKLNQPKAVSVAAAGTPAKASSAAAAPQHAHQSSPFDKPGYATFVEDGRLWVFEEGSKELAQFKEHGEPAKVVIRPGAGPNRMTIKSVDAQTIDGYMLSKPGYVAFVEDGRLWVFEEGSKDLTQFMEHGEPAKVVIRPGAGPNRMTIKSVDAQTIDGYLSN